MNILIFEYITGGGMVGEGLPASLVKEGELMLHAVANDFAEIDNTQVSVLLDYRLRNTKQKFNEIIVSSEQSYTQVIEKVASNIDALLIIAPETDSILTNLCKKYAQFEFLLLNSSYQSIALMSDKLKSFQYLRSFGISQIPSYTLKNITSIQAEKLILKPRDGVGCEGVRMINSSDDINEVLTGVNQDSYFVQPYLNGVSASLSLLCCEGMCELLSVNKQILIEKNNCLELIQCKVNAFERGAFIDFSEKLISTLPELKGYVGVDVLIDGNEIYLIEINPRLTTSYVGLKSALKINPTELILYVFLNNKLPNINLVAGDEVIVNLGEEYAA